MKQILNSAILLLLSLISFNTFSQCEPEDCLDRLPAWGGICDSSLTDGMVNQYYNDFLSFNVTNGCVDAATLDLWYKAISAKILKIHSFSFSKLPAGLTCSTDETEYTPPASSCGVISGIPTEAGYFDATIGFLANVKAWPFSPSCSGFITINKNNITIKASLTLIVLPDPGFTGLDSLYCILDTPVVLTPTGNTGGTFSGQGVDGNTFSPSIAGAGTHEIKYSVSVQQGAAFAPAANYSVFNVTVIPANVYFADVDADKFISETDSAVSCEQPDKYILKSNSLGTDCDDSNFSINPLSADIPDNGIDEDCNGSDSTTVGIYKIFTEKCRIYPNPVNEKFKISGFSGKAVIYLSDLSGKLIFTKEIRENESISTGILQTGIYFLSIQTSEDLFYQKFVKE